MIPVAVLTFDPHSLSVPNSFINLCLFIDVLMLYRYVNNHIVLKLFYHIPSNYEDYSRNYIGNMDDPVVATSGQLLLLLLLFFQCFAFCFQPSPLSTNISLFSQFLHVYFFLHGLLSIFFYLFFNFFEGTQYKTSQEGGGLKKNVDGTNAKRIVRFEVHAYSIANNGCETVSKVKKENVEVSSLLDCCCICLLALFGLFVCCLSLLSCKKYRLILYTQGSNFLLSPLFFFFFF